MLCTDIFTCRQAFGPKVVLYCIVICSNLHSFIYPGAFNEAVKTCGHISVMVNNAGIADEFNFEKCIAVNLVSRFLFLLFSFVSLFLKKDIFYTNSFFQYQSTFTYIIINSLKYYFRFPVAFVFIESVLNENIKWYFLIYFYYWLNTAVYLH